MSRVGDCERCGADQEWLEDDEHCSTCIATTEKPMALMDNMYERANNRVEFRQELETLLNRYSIEQYSDSPDFVLADYLMECLRALEIAVHRRREFGIPPGASDGTVSDPSQQ